MSLIVLGVVCVGVGVYVEGLKMISIYYTADRLISVGPAVALRSRLAVILLEF